MQTERSPEADESASLRGLARLQRYAEEELSTMRELRLYLHLQVDALTRSATVADVVEQSTTYLLTVLSVRRDGPYRTLEDIDRVRREKSERAERMHRAVDAEDRDRLAREGQPWSKPSVLE